MRNKCRFITIIQNSLAASLFLAASNSVFANVIGSSVQNSDGTVTYSYLVDNSTGSFDVAAWSLEFGFSSPDWNQLDVASGGEVTVPNQDWAGDVGTPVLGQSAQDFLSLDANGDVAIGKSLSGFSFTSKLPPAVVTFHEFSATGETLTGTTIGPANTVPDGNGPLAAIAFAAVAVFAAGVRPVRRD